MLAAWVETDRVASLLHNAHISVCMSHQGAELFPGESSLQALVLSSFSWHCSTHEKAWAMCRSPAQSSTARVSSTIGRG